MDEHEPPEVDPNALTRPMTTVTPAGPASAPSPPPRSELVPPASVRAESGAPIARGPYVHRFGSVPSHLFGRTLAFLVDWFAVAFILATFGFHAYERGFFMLASRNAAGFVSLAGLAFGAAIVFAFLCEVLFGTTLGKLVFALHVRRGDGRHAGPGRIFVRTLLRPIDVLLVGPLLILITPRRQRLGDFAGGTVVSRSRIGLFAPVLGIALVIALVYAQATLGGGIDSGIGVGAETANYAPGLLAGAAAAVEGMVNPSVSTTTQRLDAAPTGAPQVQNEPTGVPQTQNDSTTAPSTGE